MSKSRIGQNSLAIKNTFKLTFFFFFVLFFSKPFSPTFSPCFPRVKKNCLVSFTKNNNEENYQCLQQIYPKSSSFQWFSAKSDKTNQFMFIPFKEIMRRTIKGVLGKLPLKIDRRIFVSRNAAKTPIDDNDSFQARKSQMFN